MKKIIWFVLPLALVACSGNEEGFDASGTFEATEIIVSSEATGKILELSVEEGMPLVSGVTVGLIDSSQLYLKRLQLASSVDAVGKRRLDVGKQIAALEQQIATQKFEKARIERLVVAEVGNQKQLDDINASILVLEKQLEAQKSTIERSNASITDEQRALEMQVAQIDDQLLKCRITSPIDGVVLVKYAEAGEVATTGKALFKVADVDRMILRAYITSSQLTQLQIGQKVGVSSDFGEESVRHYEGTVTWISDKSEFTPKTIQTKDERANLVYAIKIAVENDGYLKIGMYGDVKFTDVD